MKANGVLKALVACRNISIPVGLNEGSAALGIDICTLAGDKSAALKHVRAVGVSKFTLFSDDDLPIMLSIENPFLAEELGGLISTTLPPPPLPVLPPLVAPPPPPLPPPATAAAAAAAFLAALIRLAWLGDDIPKETGKRAGVRVASLWANRGI